MFNRGQCRKCIYRGKEEECIYYEYIEGGDIRLIPEEKCRDYCDNKAERAKKEIEEMLEFIERGYKEESYYDSYYEER